MSTGPVDGGAPPPGYDPYADGADGTTDVGGDEYPPEETGGVPPEDGYVPPDEEAAAPAVKTQELVDSYQAEYDRILASDMPHSEKNAALLELKEIIRQLKGLDEGEPIPQELQNQIDAFAASQAPAEATGPDGEPIEEDPNVALKTELEAYKESISSNPNLTDAKKQEYLGKIDQWLSGMELKTLDAEAIQPLFDQLKSDVTTASLYTPAAQALAQATGSDPETIEAAARAKNIDLSNPPSPLTQDFVNFLKEISPELAEKLGKAEEAIKARNDSIQPSVDAANAQNSANSACSSDNDNTDMKAFQTLYDLKYHQDPKSKDAMNAMIEANTSLCSLLNAAWPNTATPPTAPTGTGWEAYHEGYQNAGNITFNGATIDIFNSTTGGLNVGSPDTEPEVPLVTIQYDWEGSGDWEDKQGRPSITKYGEDSVATNIYDDG